VEDQAARDLVARVEDLLDEVDSLAEREKCMEVVEALVTLYGEGLARMVAAANGAGTAFAEDELVEHLLLLHDLHPVPVEERIAAAVTAAGGGADLLFIEDGVAHLRAVAGSCATGATAATKQQAIAEAIQKAAPEVERVEIMDVPQPTLVLPQVRIHDPGAAPA
jgi:flavin-binding protein dodecin